MKPIPTHDGTWLIRTPSGAISTPTRESAEAEIRHLKSFAPAPQEPKP